MAITISSKRTASSKVTRTPIKIGTKVAPKSNPIKLGTLVQPTPSVQGSRDKYMGIAYPGTYGQPKINNPTVSIKPLGKLVQPTPSVQGSRDKYMGIAYPGTYGQPKINNPTVSIKKMGTYTVPKKA